MFTVLTYLLDTKYNLDLHLTFILPFLQDLCFMTYLEKVRK